MNNFYANKELEEIFGKRPKGVMLFDAMELGWACPISPKHEITYSEFNDHIWCYTCEKDFFSLLCPKQMNPFTTKAIFEKEKKEMAPEMAEWTTEKYVALKRRPR